MSFVLLICFLVVLWLAGGASRADVLGQVVVRGAAWAGILVAILFGAWPEWRACRPLVLILLAAFALVCIQIVPLPPNVWQALPGRGRFVEIAPLAGVAQPWRPLAIVPDGAFNAAASLTAPFAALIFLAGSTKAERTWLPGILLAIIGASMLLGVLQFSGAGFANPLVNYPPGDVSGNFANRNHLALSLALGCVIAPVWALVGDRRPGWRAPVAFGLVLLFVLIILASGSRAGIVLGALGLVVGLLAMRGRLRRLLARGPRWLFPAIIAGVVGIILVFVLLSVAADRAISVDRAFAMDAERDMRARALPTVFALITTYFPAGSGFGSFDPVFRIHEPFALLKPTYFNHAHNDFAEVVLEGGLPAALLLAAAIGWWVRASVRAWRAPATSSSTALARAGSGMLLLVLVASLVDFAARTPFMMAMIVVASFWLSEGAREGAAQTLPKRNQQL